MVSYRSCFYLGSIPPFLSWLDLGCTPSEDSTYEALHSRSYVPDPVDSLCVLPQHDSHPTGDFTYEVFHTLLALGLFRFILLPGEARRVIEVKGETWCDKAGGFRMKLGVPRRTLCKRGRGRV